MYNIDTKKTFGYRDEYERQVTAKNIYDSIKNTEFYSPCLLDGKWGSGKTEFCHKLYNYIINANTLQKDKIQNDFILTPIYINVFNAERINNPFLTLMGGIAGSMNEFLPDPKPLTEIASNILNTEIELKPIGIAALKDITSLLLSKLKSYAPDMTEAMSDQITKGISKDIEDNMFFDAFKKVNDLDNEYQKFSEELENFATQKQPILFIIDELDRCRPSFAIQFLECIKHFFNVDNVYFILSCNVEQLLASIEHLYGSKIDAENYLEKFFEDKITLNNLSKKYDANISILRGLTPNHFLGSLNSPTLIEFLFDTCTLRQHQKINSKYTQLLKDNNISLQLQSVMQNTLLGHLTLFMIAYLIILQGLKSFNDLVNNPKLKQAIKYYYEQIHARQQYVRNNDSDVQQYITAEIDTYFKRLKYAERDINIILEKTNIRN